MERGEEIMNNELFHYGMPRRSGRYPWGSGDRPYQSVKNVLKGKRRSDYFTSERTIPKGTKMFRSSSSSSPDFSKNKSTYVTYLESDRDLYKGGHIRFRDNAEKVYEYEMTLKDDLRIPSRETFKSVVNDVIKKNPKLLKESVESFLDEYIPKNTWDRYYIEFDEDTGKMDSRRWDKFVNDSYMERKDIPIEEQWGSIAVSLGKADNLKTAIIDELKKDGYNSMVDEAGVGGSGRAVEGADPLIIFDSSILSVNKVKEVTPREEKKSSKNYDKWVSKPRTVNKNKW